LLHIDVFKVKWCVAQMIPPPAALPEFIHQEHVK
jgi:hypothetical protein